MRARRLLVCVRGAALAAQAPLRVLPIRRSPSRSAPGDAGEADRLAHEFQIDGKQYVVLAVSGNDGAKLLAYALP